MKTIEDKGKGKEIKQVTQSQRYGNINTRWNSGYGEMYGDQLWLVPNAD